MIIVVISPHFPPMPGGVSDHTERLCLELVRKNNTIALFSNTQYPHEIEHINHYNLTDLITILPKIKPDLIILQFTPLMYAPTKYGITYKLIADLIKIKHMCKIFGIIHESHYPFHFSLKGFLIGIPHIIQFSLLAHLIDRCFFSNEAICAKWKKILYWRKNNFMTLPVFSNIRCFNNSSGSEREKINLLFFGGSHPTNQHQFVISAYKKIKEQYHDEVQLTVIGTSANDMKIKDKSDINFLTNIPESEVSHHLKNSTLVLAPFSDGVTTRRGTMMAALSHERPVLTTIGPLTRPDVPWETICATSENNQNKFASTALDLINNPEKRIKLAKSGKQYYQDNFSVDKVVTKLMSHYCP